MTQTFTITADDDLKWKIRLLATESRRSSSQYIRQLIDEAWKQREKETNANTTTR